MEENTLSVLKIAPGQHPQQVEIDNDLKALQQAVDSLEVSFLLKQIKENFWFKLKCQKMFL
jgi:hypothetical protein